MLEANFNLLNDEELINLISKHNYKAFKELVARYFGNLFYFLQYFAISDNDINTLLEKIFTEVWQKSYIFKNDFKKSIYKKLLKQIKFKNTNFQNKNHEILVSLKKQDLIAVNLYYFSGLNEKEIANIYNNIDIKLLEIDKFFLDRYQVSLYEFICELNINKAPRLNYSGNLIKNVTKYRQVNKLQPIIVIISLIPLILLIITLIYSIHNSKKIEESRREEIVELFDYLFGN